MATITKRPYGFDTRESAEQYARQLEAVAIHRGDKPHGVKKVIMATLR